MIRDMRSHDLSEVMSIERNAQVSPWSRLSFEESLNREHYCRVLERQTNGFDAQIVAYSIVCAVATELHILNFVVAKPAQGQGWAHPLMDDVFSYATAKSLDKIFLEVRTSNMIAQQLYRKWGFEQISIRPKYYQAQKPHGKREDAVIMCRHLSNGESQSTV